MSLAGPTGRAWAALDGAAGRRVRAGRLGKRPGRDRSPAWFQLAAGLAPGLLACLPGIHVKVTVAWPYVCAGTGPAMPPTTAGWNTGQMPGPSGPGIARVRRWCQQRVPGHARDRVRVECDVGRRHLTIVEYGRPGARALAANGHGSWSPGSATPGHQDLAAVLAGPSPALRLCDELEPSPGIGDPLREIDRDRSRSSGIARPG